MSHVTDRQIENFLSHSLSPAEWLAACRHLSECETCRESCLRRYDAALPIRDSLLGLRADLQAAADEHLTYEQISGLVDGTFDDAEMEIADSHLAVCEDCAREHRELRRFRGTLAQQVGSPRTAGWFWSRTLWAGAGVMATLLAVVLPLGLQNRRIKNDVAELRRARSEAERHPAMGRDAADPSSLALPPAIRRLVRDAVATGRLEVSPQIESLRGREGVLLSPAAGGASIRLIAPLGEVVLTPRPEFRWTAPTGATGVRVSVFDENLNPVAFSGPLTGNVWTPPGPLPRGRVLLWQIQATIDGREILAPSPPAPNARFAVLDASRAQRLEAANAQFAGLPLVLGLLYAQDGALTEAREQLRLLLEANPDSEVARKLVDQVEDAIQKPAPATANPAQ